MNTLVNVSLPQDTFDSEVGFTKESSYLAEKRKVAISYLGSKWILFKKVGPQVVKEGILSTRQRPNLANSC